MTPEGERLADGARRGGCGRAARAGRRLTLRALAAAAAALALLAAALPSGASASAAAATGGTTFDALACASAAECYVLGNNPDSGAMQIVRVGVTGALGEPEAGAGASWPDWPARNGLACASPSRCWAVAGDALVPVDAATGSPGAATAVHGVRILYAIACGSATGCYAGGTRGTLQDHTAVVVAIDDGRPGTAFGVPGLTGTGSSQVEAAACTSASTCLVAGIVGTGGFVARVAGGAVTHVAQSAAVRLSGLACPSASACYGVGSAAGAPVVVPVDPATGAVGAPVSVRGAQGGLDAVACPSRASCIAVGVSPTSGGWWVPVKDGVPGAVHTLAGLNATAAGIACPLAARCLVAGGPVSAGVIALLSA